MATSLSHRENKEEEGPEPNPGVPGEQSPSEEHRAEAHKKKAGLGSPEGKVPWSPLGDLLCATMWVWGLYIV